MKLTIGLNEVTEESDAIDLEKWNSIYLTYALTQGGFGIERFYLDGVERSTGLSIKNAPSHSVFQTTDVIKIGGAFTGKLKRVQIYSPATFGTTTGNSIFPLLQEINPLQ